MFLISINKVYYERSYDLLNLNDKNDIIFAPTYGKKQKIYSIWPAFFQTSTDRCESGVAFAVRNDLLPSVYEDRK